MAAVTGTAQQFQVQASAAFMEAVGTHTPIYTNVVDTVSSLTDRQEYAWQGAVPQFRRWLGERRIEGLRNETFTVENYIYELSLGVKRTHLDDDQTGSIRERIGQMGFRAAEHNDVLLGQILGSASGSAFLSYDGFPFFSSNHQRGSSGSQDNDLFGEGSTTADMKSHIENGIQQLRSFLDDQGFPINQSAWRPLVMVPPQLEFRAKEAIRAQQIESGSNILSGEGVDFIVNPYLQFSNEFFVIATGAGVNAPFIYQTRDNFEFESLDSPTSDHVVKNDEYLFLARKRDRIWLKEPLSIVRFGITTLS